MSRRTSTITALIPLLLLAAGSAAAGTFVPDNVASSSGLTTSQYTDIVVDAAGTPHLAYTREFVGGNANLYYAWLDGEDWQREQTHAGEYINQCAIDLDGSGVPHFAIQVGHALGWILNYVTYDNGLWSTDPPEAGVYDECSGGWPDLVIDSGNVPWISFHWKVDDASTDGDLRLAFKSGGTWSVETVDGGPDDVGEYTAIALSALERPRISYYDRTNGNLMYARRSGTGSWTLELVDDLPNVGTWTDIAVGGDGDIHISYINENTRAVRYARRTDGVWSTEAVPDAVHSAGDGTSIAVDANGDPHIAYYYGQTQRLRHVWKSGGGWHSEPVDIAADRVRPALALDQADVPHVSYMVEPSQEVWYATYEEEVGVPSGPPPSALSLRVFPNPASSGASVRVEYAAGKAAAGPTDLAVYDLAGRKVRTLLAGGATGGSARWDGRTDAGAPAPAGTYVVRCAQGGRAASRRVQLVR